MHRPVVASFANWRSRVEAARRNLAASRQHSGPASGFSSGRAVSLPGLPRAQSRQKVRRPRL